MIEESYKVIEFQNFHRFVFESDGPKGIIVKIVHYTLMGDNVYNLGFGDFRRGRIDDKAISGNKDLVKVMNTVAKTIYLFTERYPERKVYIKAVDEKRSRFYHSVFEKKAVEIESNFVIRGLTEKN